MIKEALRLNLGSRNRAIPGFLGIDSDQHEGVDIVADVSVLPYEDGAISEIYASHILEHFPQHRTLVVLKEWARVLESGGILYVAVPDFKRVVELYAITEREGIGLNDWMANYLWGDQGYETAYHYTGFDFQRLRKFLIAAGFSEASQVENFPVGHELDCSRKISTMDGKPISLNIVAVK